MVFLKKFLKFVGLNHFIMPQEITYDAFCNLYVKEAMKIATIVINDINDPEGKGKENHIHPLIDQDYVKAVAVSYSLDKVYKTYDVNHESGASIHTYFNTIIRNCIISELKKAWTDIKHNHPEFIKVKDPAREARTQKGLITGIKGRGDNLVKPDAHTYIQIDGVYERKDMVHDAIAECVQKLNPMDQIILNCWQHEEKNYVNKALELLGFEITTQSQGMIRARLKRSLAMLNKMMGGAKPDYRDIYISSSKETVAAYIPGPVDRNLVRRRGRAVQRELSTQIDYMGIAKKLYISDEE